MVVLSFGMLSYTALQSASIKYGKMAQFRTSATQLATDFADRLRANSDAAAAGNYDYQAAYAELTSPIALPTCAVAVCTAAEVAAIDLAQWRNAARIALPGGSLFAEIDATAPIALVVDLWVLWLDPEVHGADEIGFGCPADIGNAISGPRCMHFRLAL